MKLGGSIIGADIKYLRIGELARYAGVSSRTIDYYTQLGLIHEEKRSIGNHRLYSENSVQTIKIIKELQHQNICLQEICCLIKENKDNNELLNEVASINNLLDNLQKKITKLYSQINNNQDECYESVARELSKKSLHVIKTLLIILGEPML